MNFNNENIESGFFYAINNLPSSWYDSTTNKSVELLKFNTKCLLDALKKENAKKVRQYLNEILPLDL
jgi:hypothetical protein